MRLRFFVLVWLALAITGCSNGYVPVLDYSGAEGSGPATVAGGVHVVRPGETLYSIAWRYGWDYRALAKANGIDPPYTIYPGQRIRLAGNPDASTGSSPSSSGREHAAVTHRSPAHKERHVSYSGGEPSWRWPADGKIISRFSRKKVGETGISIAGDQGDPVRAAADGVVVYRGDGLTGYGKLLIIKHNDRWLSAYAHNESMLVKEGEQVKAGQRIATMGATGTYRTQLHFEIRRDGKPVDPLKELPPR